MKIQLITFIKWSNILTNMFLKVKRLRFVSLVVAAFIPTMTYAQQPTTPSNPPSAPTQPALTTEQVCQNLLVKAKEKLSATELTQDLNYCKEKLGTLDATIFKNGGISIDQSIKLEAAYFCDIYSFTWLPADKKTACAPALEALIKQNPDKRILQPSLPDQPDAPTDTYSKLLAPKLGVKLTDAQIATTDVRVSCDLSVFIFSRNMPEEVSVVVAEYGSIVKTLDACTNETMKEE